MAACIVNLFSVLFLINKVKFIIKCEFYNRNYSGVEFYISLHETAFKSTKMGFPMHIYVKTRYFFFLNEQKMFSTLALFFSFSMLFFFFPFL